MAAYRRASAGEREAAREAGDVDEVGITRCLPKARCGYGEHFDAVMAYHVKSTPLTRAFFAPHFTASGKQRHFAGLKYIFDVFHNFLLGG